jgi:hypothetical protein
MVPELYGVWSISLQLARAMLLGYTAEEANATLKGEGHDGKSPEMPR